jgi:DNA-binding CsgD family transcriptional regulator
MVHEARAEIDLLRGDVMLRARRHQQVGAIIGPVSDMLYARESAQPWHRGRAMGRTARRRPDEVRRVFPLFKAPDLTILCGRLLAAGMRACADLAEQARARRDEPAAEDAAAAAEGLASWVKRMGGVPFTDHPYMATIPAERATWEAERTRLAGPSDPAAWAAAAKAWQDLGCPHRAGYAWWRRAQAHLDAGRRARRAAAADGHAPLLAQVSTLADRARITLHVSPAAGADLRSVADPAPYGLTGRELAVLRLLAAGRTNAQIGAELFISPRTAGVHVTNILRKLGVTSRVQAAAVAERAGLLDTQRP